MDAPLPLTTQAHEAWKSHLRAGSWAIDATAGNGGDTERMRRLVGPSGHVFAFDIQEVALKATAARLRTASLESHVTLILGDHARLLDHLPCGARGKLDLIAFNLGYLPGGDHSLTTRTASTVAALHQALLLLSDSGALSVIAYRGHSSGAEEAEAVDTFFSRLPRPWNRTRHVVTGGRENPGPVWHLATQTEQA